MTDLVDAPVESPPKTAKDVLNGAVRVIEEFGWAQHKMLTADNRVCLYGAIQVAISGFDGTRYYMDPTMEDGLTDEQDVLLADATAMVEAEVQRIWVDSPMSKEGVYFGSAVSYNDTPGRTKEEIIAILRGAAEHA